MSKVFLISANISTDPLPVYPIGMGMIASALAGDGHHVEQFDFLAAGKSKEELQKSLAGFAPDYVGISMRNIDNVDSFTSEEEWFLDHTKELIETVRGVTSSAVIAGGAGFSIMPEEILDYINADYGVAGEGERAVCRLIRDLDSGIKPPRLIHGDRLLSGEEIASPLVTADLLGYYMEESGAVNLQSKRGCPHKCLYCTYPSLEGNRFRVRKPAAVVDTIEEMKNKYNADTFSFTDSVFNDTGGHYLELAEELLSRNLGIRWSGFFSPVPIGRENLKLLKRSGLYALELGTDAASDTTLAGINKMFSFDDVLRFTQECVGEELPTAHFIMFGGPGEDEKTISEGLENIEKLGNCVVFAFSGIRILKGTGLYARAVKDGIIAESESLLRPAYYFSPEIDPEKMNDMITVNFRKRPDRIFPPSDALIRLDVLRRFGFKHAGWDMMVQFG